MLNRNQLESLLKINGVPTNSPDEHIRSVLLSARYSNDEVDTAIMVLREDTKTNQTRVDGLHKVFRTDQALKPDEISNLLGIQVNISDLPTMDAKNHKVSTAYHAIVWLLSITLALITILIYMYLYKVGLFHPSSRLALF